MKNMKKVLLVILIGAVAMLSSFGTVKAQNSYVTISSASEIPTTFPNGQSYVPSSSANLTDYIGYFTGNNAGWEPRIKFMGTDASNIENYLFCLSFHDLAPNSSISYTRAEYDTVEKMNQVRYIIENGFGDSFATYEDLKWHYYVTQLAIWQLQGMNGFDITNFNTNDTVAKNAILNLVEGAKNAPMDNTKYVGKYVANKSGYQMLVPAIIYQVNEPVQKVPVYYSRPSKAPQVTQTVQTRSITVAYKSSCDGKYIAGHQMRLVDETRVEVKSWTSASGKVKIDNLLPGTYTIEDIDNGESMTITIENIEGTQNFIMTPTNEVCETTVDKDEIVEEEKTITETIVTEVSNVVNPSTGVGAAGAGSLLGGAIALYRHSKKKLKMLRK